MFYLPKSIFKYFISTRNMNLFSVDSLLSKKNRESCIKKFQLYTKSVAIKSKYENEDRQAAVLIPLCVCNDELSLLYTLRAADLKTHRGQVSFPGGMLDEHDTSLEMTALRENEEELGISSNEVDLWGSGNLISVRNNVKVLPVVGCLKRPFQLDYLKLNRSEVEEVFTVRVKDLCDPNFMAHTQFKNAYSTPVFLGGKRRIWGITAVITHMFLRSLLPADSYKHHIPYISNVSKL